MQPRKIINDTRAKIMRGKKLSPAEVMRYENAVAQMVTEDRVTLMFLYFAETLHDVHGFGHKRTTRIISEVDKRMHDFLDPDFDLDDLIVRVYKKTQYIVAGSEEEFDHTLEVLKSNGFPVERFKEVN